MKSCIAYYSRIGNTEIAAQYLAEKIGAKVIKLEDKTNYGGIIGFIKGGMNASKAKKAEMDSSIYDEISTFERIILATPVWAGKTTPAMNAVLENVDFEGKEVYVMTTQAKASVEDTEIRRAFYMDIIEKKKGKFVDIFSLQGSSPNKPARSKEDLSSQVDRLVNIG
jgi:flavodoxin